MIFHLYTLLPISRRRWFLFIAILVLTVGQAAIAQVSSLTATVVATPSTVPAQATVTLSATVVGGTAPYSYTFTGPGTIAQTGSNTATVSGLPAGVQTFTVTARDSSQPASQTVTQAVSITVAAATLNGSTNLCTGQSATLSVGITSGTGPFTVVYGTGPGSTVIIPNYTSGAPIVISPTSSTTYTLVSVLGPDGSVGPITGVASVVVNPLPTVALQGSLALCSGGTTSLTATGGAAYSFAGPNLNTFNSTGLVTISQAGSYSVIVINGITGCFRTLPFTIQANTGPAPTIVVSNTITCTVPATQITVASGASNYLFTGPNFSQNGISNVASVTAAGTYVVITTNSTGCTATTSTVVTGNTAPPATPALIASNPITCLANSVTLTASGGSNNTNYIFGGTNFLQVSPSNVAVVSSVGTYSVVVTGSNGCRATAITTVRSDTVQPPAFLSSNGGGQLTCAQTSVTLAASVGADNYVFSGPNLFVITSNNIFTVSTPGTYSVVIIDATNGCSSRAVTTVTENRTDARATLVASGSLTCAQTSVTLTATGTGSTFLFQGAGFSQLGTTPIVRVNRPGIYTVTSSGSPGCSASATVTVTGSVTPPLLTLQVSGPLTCTQTSVTLTTGSSGLTYQFTGPLGFSQSSQTGIVTTSVAGLYSVFATSPTTSCTATASATVEQISCASSLVLLPPTYNCQTGAITFNTSGGDGSAIVFAAPGIQRASASSNTGTVEAGLRTDPKTVLISATQNGLTVTYLFDLRTACAARIAASEPESALSVAVLGNPTQTEAVEVEIGGAEGQTVQVSVHDMQGRLLTEQQTKITTPTERRTIRLGNNMGLYLLHVSTPTQRQTTKIVRQ